MNYGFFILLGGAAVSLKDLDPSSADKKEPWASLSMEGILSLARQDIFIYITPESIEDKSKSSVLQKTLVVVQVLWFLIQCLVRKVYGLPLTLLEVHTVVHVFCAVIIYLVWWHVRSMQAGHAFPPLLLH